MWGGGVPGERGATGGSGRGVAAGNGRRAYPSGERVGAPSALTRLARFASGAAPAGIAALTDTSRAQQGAGHGNGGWGGWGGHWQRQWACAGVHTTEQAPTRRTKTNPGQGRVGIGIIMPKDINTDAGGRCRMPSSPKVDIHPDPASIQTKRRGSKGVRTGVHTHTSVATPCLPTAAPQKVPGTTTRKARCQRRFAGTARRRWRGRRRAPSRPPRARRRGGAQGAPRLTG